MDFGLDETQREVEDLVADVLRREIDPERIAETQSSETGYDSAAWKALTDAGLLTLSVPEAHDGAGLTALESSLVLTEVGRRAAPLPALATVALGVLPLVAAGTTAQQGDLLPRVASGAILSGALDEPGTPMPPTPRTVARREGDDWVLSGIKTAVPYASAAHRILVTATTEDGVAVLLTDPTAAGVSLHRQSNSSGTPEYGLRLDEVRVPHAALLGEGAQSVLHGYALAGACAVADGAMLGALELTAEHVGQREQFGKPLATFQSVAGQIADTYVVRRTLHLATRSAWWRLGTGRDAAEDLDVAGYWLAHEAMPALHTCHHLHGGVGVDVTYPMHHYSALVKDLVRRIGGSAQRTEHLADRIGA